MKVFLDDLRPAPPGWTRAYWPDEVIGLLESGRVSALSLDHDLGDDSRGTGYDVLLWIERAVALHGFQPPTLFIHSANPVAAQRMAQAVSAIDRLRAGEERRATGIIPAAQISPYGRNDSMEDLELLARLEQHESFGVAMVQRITGFGHQRATEVVGRLEAAGAIQRDHALAQWRTLKPREQLRALYEQHKTSIQGLQDLPSGKIEPLILMDVPQGWASAGQRVLIVGQETLGWDFQPGDYYDWPYAPITRLEEFLAQPASVEAMMHGYRAFEFARYQPGNFNSPFWRAHRRVRQATGEEETGFDTQVLYTNLFKTAVDEKSIVKNGTWEEADSVWRISAGLLTREIEILKPDTVIFFTGPDYDRYLELEFAGLEWEAVGEHQQRRFSKLTHAALPAKTWRTYHPGYLSRGHWHLLEEICAGLV